MALSFDSVKKAFKVFNQLELENICSFPPDFEEIDEGEKENPVEEKTYGIDKKCDNGWENLFFFKKNPSKEFMQKWEELKDTVPNSSFCKDYKENPEYKIFGWF